MFKQIAVLALFLAVLLTGSIYDVNNDDVINFQDAGLCWVNRDTAVPYNATYDVNQDGTVNFQDAGLCWVNRGPVQKAGDWSNWSDYWFVYYRDPDCLKCPPDCLAILPGPDILAPADMTVWDIKVKYNNETASWKVAADEGWVLPQAQYGEKWTYNLRQNYFYTLYAYVDCEVYLCD